MFRNRKTKQKRDHEPKRYLWNLIQLSILANSTFAYLQKRSQHRSNKSLKEGQMFVQGRKKTASSHRHWLKERSKMHKMKLTPARTPYEN